MVRPTLGTSPNKDRQMTVQHYVYKLFCIYHYHTTYACVLLKIKSDVKRL